MDVADLLDDLDEIEFIPPGREITDDEIETLLGIFCRSKYKVQGAAAEAEANRIARAQPAFTKKFSEIILKALRQYAEKSGLPGAETSRTLMGLIGGAPAKATKSTDEGYSVLGEAPIFIEADFEYIEEFVGDHTKSDQYSIAGAAMCIAMFLSVRADTSGSFPVTVGDAFGREYVRSLAQLEMFRFSQRAKSHQEISLFRTENRIRAVDADIDKREAECKRLIMAIESAKIEMQEFQNKIVEGQSDIGQMEGKIEDAYQTLISQVGLRETDNLWIAEAANARRDYYLSLGVVLLCLVGLPIVAFLCSSSIIAYLASIEAAALAFANEGQNVAAAAVAVGRLILIGVPVAFLVWAIKIGVRFNVRSMLLMDDAKQRVAMLNTFLFMMKNGTATIQDRGALLEALFRRVPGHGPETVEPPNLTDLMKYGQEMGKTSP